MEEKIVIKVEPVWLEDIAGPPFEHVELESAVACVKEETNPELTEPGPSQGEVGSEIDNSDENSTYKPDNILSDRFQPAADVMKEITVEELLVPHIKQVNSVDNVAVLTTHPLHQCGACCYTFALKRNSLTPKGERASYCAICSMVFCKKLCLKNHELTHSSDKSYCCEHCGGRFCSKSKIQRHMLSHTNERPHRCLLCSRKFSQKSHLKTHMLTHSKEKLHSCILCGSKFSVKSALNRHMQTHSRERPHGCTLCSRKFARKNSLKIHMVTHSKRSQH